MIVKPKKKPSVTALVFKILVILVGVIGFAFASFSIYDNGGPINYVVFVGILVFVCVLPMIGRSSLNVLANEVNKIQTAIAYGTIYTVPEGLVGQRFMLAFLPFWVIIPLFTVLPGFIGLYIVIPGLVIGILRIVKVYPLFEDLGIPKKKYAGIHVFSFLLTFSLFIAIKIWIES